LNFEFRYIFQIHFEKLKKSMKYLQKFRMFRESDWDWTTTDSGEKFKNAPEASARWLKGCIDGTWSKDPRSGLVNVEGDVDFSFQRLRVVPHGVQFGKVAGNFAAFGNDFRDLKGFPFFVKKKFNVADNPIENYEGAPFAVGWSFKSDDIDMRGKEWNAKKVLFESPDKKALQSAPFMKAECWNRLFEFYPAEGVTLIAHVWNLPEFADIRKDVKIPAGQQDKLNLRSELSDLGLF